MKTLLACREVHGGLPPNKVEEVIAMQQFWLSGLLDHLVAATAHAACAVNRKLGSKPSSRRALSVERYPFGSAML